MGRTLPFCPIQKLIGGSRKVVREIGGVSSSGNAPRCNAGTPNSGVLTRGIVLRHLLLQLQRRREKPLLDSRRGSLFSCPLPLPAQQARQCGLLRTLPPFTSPRHAPVS